ncbi:DUF1636 domain-containing protein [Sphingobium sp. CR28]|uniref:DUF1636 domain-containing protein n=1 Tax=Sphingobium sp. CR28 TaxID=3400272 RepID=UPI003FEE509C
MLKRSGDGTTIIICNTCRHSANEREDADGRRGGARLAEALRRIMAQSSGHDGIAMEEMACLFACGDFCTVHLRASEKIGYILGRFEPTDEAAQALLDYAKAYAASAEGQVPFREWPDGVKGHFIARTPPPGYIVA